MTPTKAAHCPTCKAGDGKPVQLRVVGTRHRGGLVFRLRKCPACGLGVQTAEQAVLVRPAGTRPVPLVVGPAAPPGLEPVGG